MEERPLVVMDRPAAVLVRLDPQGPVLCAPGSPFLRADDTGILRGDGIFERFLVIARQARHFEDHLARLARSAELVQLEVPGRDAWKAAVSAAIGAWPGGDEWSMRLVCTRGPEDVVAPSAYVLGQELSGSVLRQRQAGVAVVTVARGMPSGLSEEAPWLLLGAKTLSYAVNMAAKRWAESRGADDAVFVGSDGLVWEGATSGVVVARGGRLTSPPASVGILDSISVARLFSAAEAAGWDVARQELTLDELFEADGVWLSSSIRFARVHTVDGKSLPDAPAHEELAALAADS
ncbi:MAG TPA: aminodeoxychorismate lyase [Acidimicrobiales bacterium]|nr:aminodeoxychorismate lyase [Acidimicrobiales bacterium]